MKIRPNRKKDRRHAPWTKTELSHLGKVPDSTLARRLHRTIEEIVARREYLRIGLPLPPRRWTAREIKLLGTMPDAELAALSGRTRDAVNQRRSGRGIPVFQAVWRAYTTPDDKLLGTM